MRWIRGPHGHWHRGKGEVGGRSSLGRSRPGTRATVRSGAAVPGCHGLAPRGITAPPRRGSSLRRQQAGQCNAGQMVGALRVDDDPPGPGQHASCSSQRTPATPSTQILTWSPRWPGRSAEEGGGRAFPADGDRGEDRGTRLKFSPELAVPCQPVCGPVKMTPGKVELLQWRVVTGCMWAAARPRKFPRPRRVVAAGIRDARAPVAIALPAPRTAGAPSPRGRRPGRRLTDGHSPT